MLVLTRRIGEEIIIGGTIRLKVVEVHKNSVRLALVAPKNVLVDRAEVHRRRLEFAGLGNGEVGTPVHGEGIADGP